MVVNQILNVLLSIIALSTLVLTKPLVSAENNNSTLIAAENKANQKWTWMDGDFEISTTSLYRIAYYKFWIGTNIYEWKQSMPATSNPKKTCHSSGVVCAKSDTQGKWVEVWYAHSHQKYGTMGGEYDYTCSTIEARSDNNTVTDVSKDHRKPGITGCWSWHTFSIAGCFGEGWHSK